MTVRGVDLWIAVTLSTELSNCPPVGVDGPVRLPDVARVAQQWQWLLFACGAVDAETEVLVA